MKRLIITCFTLLSALVYALPFQAPMPGNYQCFSSQESLLDVNAQDTGAALTINEDGSYTFTTSNASENGSVQATEDTTLELEQVFQNGSSLSLQPSSGSSAYEGLFVTDKQGGMYVFVYTNNGLTLRCQSPGADIAKAIQQAANEQIASQEATSEESGTTEQETVATEQTPTTDTPENDNISYEQLTPLQQVQSGRYNCFQSLNHQFFAYNQDPDDYFYDEEPDIFDVLIYDDGSTLTIEKGHLNRDAYDGIYWTNDDGSKMISGAKDKYVSQYVRGSYTFDATTSKLSFTGGLPLSGKMMLYGNNDEGVAALSYIVTWKENPDTTDEQYWSSYYCVYVEALESYPDLELAATTPTVDLRDITVAPSKTDVSLDPRKYPMPDVYYCYANLPESRNDEDINGFPHYLREAELTILPDFRYQWQGLDAEGMWQSGEGQFDLKENGKIKWLNGPLNPGADVTTMGEYSEPFTASFFYENWGTAIKYMNTGIDGACYQGGAREQLALLEAALKRPQEGSYTCVDNEEQQSVLELLPDNRYRYDEEEGSYSYEMNKLTTSVYWLTGPLGVTADYDYNDTTGRRDLTFTVTRGSYTLTYNEDVLTCDMQTKANLIPVYSTQTAPPAPAGSGGLDGFYASSEYDPGNPNSYSPEPASTTWTFYHFLPDGYVYEGGYQTDKQCTRTYPNSENVCRTYSVQGSTITFSDGNTITFKNAAGGAMIDGVFFEDKRLAGSRMISGTFDYGYAASTPIMNMGTNTLYEASYTFSEDGTYSYSSSSSSQTAAPSINDATGVGALASSSRFESRSGTYSIDGNTITFTTNTGSSKCSFFYTLNGDGSSINICGTDYGKL